MRRVTAGVVMTLLLVGGCGTSDDGRDGRRESTKVSYESVKSAADELVAAILPKIAATAHGELPLVRGQFLGCGLGPPSFQYSVRGELHSEVVDDVQAAESVRDVLTAAGLDVTVKDDQTVVATTDGTEVVVLRGLDIGGARIARSFSLDTTCQTYSKDDADAIGEMPAETYDHLAADS
jgi:hypothetical protein